MRVFNGLKANRVLSYLWQSHISYLTRQGWGWEKASLLENLFVPVISLEGGRQKVQEGDIPVVYMARDVIILMRENPFREPLEGDGVGPENLDFFGP